MGQGILNHLGFHRSAGVHRTAAVWDFLCLRLPHGSPMGKSKRGRSPFGRFKEIPKREIGIPLWRAFCILFRPNGKVWPPAGVREQPDTLRRGAPHSSGWCCGEVPGRGRGAAGCAALADAFEPEKLRLLLLPEALPPAEHIEFLFKTFLHWHTKEHDVSGEKIYKNIPPEIRGDAQCLFSSYLR